MTEVQELVARLRLKDEMSGPIRKVRAGISGVSDALNSPRMKQGVRQVGTGLRNAALIGAAGIGILASQVALGLHSLAELEQQVAQTEAVIKSTGGVAGITAKQVGALAEKFEDMNAVIGDEVIRSAENMLLTFTNVKSKAFEPALQAILDMNTAMGKGPEGLTTTAIQVGKALNDPIKGITALRKVGVSFTAAQIKQIKALVKSGKTLEAQKLIIAELNKEFGGSFLAQGNTTAGKIAKFQDAIEDLQRSLAERLLPVVGKVAEGLAKFLKDPAVVQAAEDLGSAIAGLFTDENISAGADVLKGVIQAARDGAPLIADAAKTVFGIVSSAVGLFRSLPPEIQKLAIGAFAINKLTGGLVANVGGAIAGGIAKAILGQFGGVINVNGAVVNVNGGAGIASAAAGAAPAAAGIGLTGAAVAVAVPVILIGGAVVSLNAIVEAAQKNNDLAAKGLTSAEITAQKYYNGTKAYQETAFKQLHGVIPTREDLESGNAKLAKALIIPINHASERQEALQAASRATSIANAEGIKQEERAAAAKNVTAAGAIKTAVDAAKLAAAQAGSQVSSAVERKKLSVVTNLNVTNRISVRDTVKTQTTFKRYGNYLS